MTWSPSHPTLPERYTVPFEMTTWAVVELGQMDEHERCGDRQKLGKVMAPGMLLIVCFGIAMGG